MLLYEVLTLLFAHCKVVTGDGLAIGTLGSTQLDFVDWTFDLNLPELLGIPVHLNTKVEILGWITLEKLKDTAMDSHGW